MSKTTDNTPAANLDTCKCGCGLRVMPRRSWVPGHDARAAGEAARALQGGDKTKRDALPTQALRDKATALADRWTQAAADKAALKAEREALKAERAASKA